MLTQYRSLSFDDQIKTMNEAKTYYENYSLDPKKKYLSDYENQNDYRYEGEFILYSNKKKIILVIYTILANGNRPYEFIRSLIEYKPIIRDGKIHNPLCEYAIGSSCYCPCKEKYHGLKGMKL
jgi:hypothetical protein